MPKFSYIATNAEGKNEKGVIEGENADDALGRLRQRGLTVTKVKPAGSGFKFGQPPKKANNAELAMFTRQLATMLGAGIPLLEGIEILAEQVAEGNKGFGAGLQELAEMVRGGTALSEAMAQYRKIFPDIYVNMVKAAEASGQMDAILDRLADYMESAESLKREIKSAMTYPVISLVMILGITGYLLVGVVPKFEKMFNSLGAELPGLTVGILAMSKWAQAN